MKKFLTILLCLAILLPAGCIVASAEEPILLRVAAFMGENEPDGFLTDPVTKYIEESLNVKLEVTHTREADWPNQLAALMAANDLPDVFILSNVTTELPKLLAAEQILCIDDYLDSATLSTDIPAIQAMIEANRMYSEDGKLYSWGLCLGDWSDGTKPTMGNYIRWDLYAELGYPEMNSYEDLLDVLEQMVALEPTTETGLPTYALGAWFGDGQSWALANIDYFASHCEGCYPIPSGYTFAINTLDSTPVEENQLTSTDSRFWTAVDFYAEAYRRGLLDPDSFTMTQQMWQDKISAGQYMYCMFGWEATDANSEFYKNEGNTKEFISIPSLNGKVEGRINNMFSGERKFCISAQTQYPEKCVELLDFVSTYENSLILINGLEGDTWNRDENGELVPTDEYIACDREDDVYRTEHGNYVWNHFMAFSNGVFWEEGNTAIDLWQFSEEAMAANMTPTMQDFLDHYGVTSQLQAYLNETEVCTINNFYVVPTLDDMMTMYVSNLSDYVYKNVFKLISCETAEEYEAQKVEFIEGAKKNNADEIFEFFYQSAVDQADSMSSLASYFE